MFVDPSGRPLKLCLWAVALVATNFGRASDLAQAIDHYHLQHYSVARQLFTAIEQKQGPTVDTDFYLGRLALWFDDEKPALTHLERAAQSVPADARIQNALGDAYGMAAQNATLFAKLCWAKRCLAAYERAVALEPNNPAWRWSLLGYYCVAPRIAGGGIEKARVQAHAIAQLDATNGRVAAVTVHLAEGSYAAAFAIFEPVLDQTPDDFVALYQVGRCAALSGQRLDQGIAALRRCLALPAPNGEGLPTSSNIHYRLGVLLDRKGCKEDARLEYARAFALNADFRPAKVTLRN